MKYIHLDGTINEDMRDTVTSALNEEGEVTFYINSTGGSTSSTEPIISMINKNHTRVTLIANGYIGSNAFNIFFRTKCKREIADKTEGMAHMARFDTSVSGRMRIQYVPKFQLKGMMKESVVEAELLSKLGCSKKIVKQYLNEIDIYFTTKKLRKMLAKSL